MRYIDSQFVLSLFELLTELSLSFCEFCALDYLIFPSLFCFSRPISLEISLVTCGGMG